jgi:hypothetical protein
MLLCERALFLTAKTQRAQRETKIKENLAFFAPLRFISGPL